MGNPISALWKVFIRISAFLRKEVVIILRQPQLLMTLVLGPFLILLVFGLGYRNEPPVLRTLFVAQPGSQLEEQIKAYAPTLGPQLSFLGVTGDREAAMESLRRGDLDLVAVAPQDAAASIQAGQQAEFQLYHADIDPTQASYISYFGEIYIAEVNRRVLQSLTAEGQVQAEDLQQNLQSARAETQSAEQALQAGDEVAARQHLAGLTSNLDQLSLAVGASLAVLNNVEGTVGSESNQQSLEISRLLNDIQTLSDELGEAQNTTSDPGQWQTRVAEINSNLNDLDAQLQTFTQLKPEVIVEPFTSTAQSIAEVQPDATNFFAPAVLALLLQHLAVTIAGLSIVHERNFGTLELFRVAPLSAGEILIGKYLSYLFFGAIVAAALTALLHLALGVPMLGNWWNYALVIGVLLFTSLGVGFVISLISRSDSQAVQYTMIALLVSVFFSGFLMSLNMLAEPVRSVSWGIPTTYGIMLLRAVALRGSFPDLVLVGILAAIGVALALLAWLILRRMISNQ
ncbi:MAG TPA: ABC transporter permease [Anaerolineales bacterium]|nr:ABC transporter permease [Anaerolineales bacterium]